MPELTIGKNAAYDGVLTFVSFFSKPDGRNLSFNGRVEPTEVTEVKLSSVGSTRTLEDTTLNMIR
jgi:hypothetical protein